MTIMYRVKLAFASLLLIAMSISFSQTPKLSEEKELELVDFKSIKKVLQQDGLSKAPEQKKNQVAALKKEKLIIEQENFSYPTEDELWGFLSEYWLIKNAQLLGWDFEKPDYGLETSFKMVLENLGFYQKKFKILLINNPSLVRTSLPGSGGEMLLLLSVPFIRSLDLSKLEISLLLLEDFFRLEAGYFKKATATEKMRRLAGTNFHGQKPDLTMVEELMKNYQQQIFHKGYSFQQQFEVTQKMDAFLKSNPELWNSYFRLLGKLDRFLKVNVQYKDYIRLFPSPEMQLKWISPEQKIL
jgi:hypothetical protein